MNQKPKHKIGWLWENMKGYRVLYAVGILGTIVYNIMQLTVPFISSKIVDLFLAGEKAAENLSLHRDLFYKLVAAMVLLTFLRTTVVYLVCLDMEKVSQKVLYRILSLIHI